VKDVEPEARSAEGGKDENDIKIDDRKMFLSSIVLSRSMQRGRGALTDPGCWFLADASGWYQDAGFDNSCFEFVSDQRDSDFKIAKAEVMRCSYDAIARP
jgi:hypothetical protein